MDINKDNSCSSDESKINELKMEITNYESRLNQEWVQVLINLRMKYSKYFTRKRNSANDAWKLILDEMYKVGAPDSVTIGKIKKKWMNLVARYKYLKLMHNPKITWPYFEQIDRAFNRNPNLFEIRKSIPRRKGDSELKILYNSNDKETFTTNLINLRRQYSSLFTGKKYAAQNGWTFIKKVLPNGKDYTIEQLSKCWQNLIQRYKSVLENEPNIEKIQWIHFPKLHEILVQRTDDVKDNLDEDVDYQSYVQSIPVIKQEVIEEDENDIEDESILEIIDIPEVVESISDESSEELREKQDISKNLDSTDNEFDKSGETANTSQFSNSITIDDMLLYFKNRDQLHAEHFNSIITLLREISNKLK